MELVSPTIDNEPQPVGITLKSFPNAVSYSFRGEVLNGNKKPEVRIPGNNMGANSFVFEGLNFGCTSSTGQGIGNLPTPCTLKATFSRRGILVRSVQLTFTFKEGALAPELMQFNFPTDIGPVDSVIFDTTVSNINPLLTAAVLDDMRITISQKTPGF